MLLKVENIQEIGRFASLKHKAAQFGALTLIFARNGYGKSTLCSVLRSSSELKGQIIAARRRLSATGDSLAHLVWKGGAATKFKTGVWDLACPGPVHIFDGEYVHRNLHVAESVTRDNKRSLISVVLGEQGVALAKVVSDLDAEQRALASEQATSEKTIKAACPGIGDVESFANATMPADLDAQITRAEQGVQLARHSLNVKDRRSFAEINLLPLEHYEALAARDVADITDDAAAKVKEHLDAHNMHPLGERWLKYGVEHQTDNSCPFCTQDTSDVPLVSAFKGYFGEAYAALSTELEAALAAIRALTAEHGGLVHRLDEHRDDIEFWGKVCDLSSPPEVSADVRDRVLGALDAIQKLLEHKAANPLAKKLLDDRDAVNGALNELQGYLDGLTKCAPAISEARTSSATADTAKAQEILVKRQALKKREAGSVKADVDGWLKRDKRRREIEVEKKKAQQDVKTYAETTAKTKQSAINDLLDLFGANFRIADTKASFVGREANTDYSIQIGNRLVPAGERSETQPSFNTVLSAGDKFTLALAFFITQVRSDAGLADATLVFDDPFSSLDAQREWETTSQLRSLAANACQVIVLSHDARFLALIEKNANGALSYQLNCDDNGTGAISAWSSAEELKDLYVRQCERVREFASTGTFLAGINGDSLVKELRPFSEDYLRNRFPGRFGPLVMLDQMATEIEAVPDDPMLPHVAELRAINEYTRDYMHGGASNPDPGALRSQCKRLVKIIGSY
ncbi:MAG TPA: AAA family ATPase [Caulobacteraceae bacterium]|jgi:wobble nucleotide-excising tRNase